MSMFTKKPDSKVVERKEPIKPIERPEVGISTAAPSTFAARTSSLIKGSSKMVPSVIGEDLTVTGNIVSKGEVQVEGEVQGDVHCQSLVVGEKATITGGLVADDIIIRGRVLGSVRAQRVTLQSSSHVEGDIHHQALAIEQGAFFEGKSRRSDNPMAGLKSDQPQQQQQKPPAPGLQQREAPRSPAVPSPRAAE